MKNYDAEQRLAINASNGTFLVLASPGCGKTDILAERIVQAHKRGISFDDMLCLTFTNRASKCMQDRIALSFNEPIDQLFVGNIHRFCSSFLFSNDLLPKNACIIDSDDVTDILLTFDADFFTNKHGFPKKDRIQQVENLETYLSQKSLHHPDSVLDSSSDLDELYQVILQANFNPDNISSYYKSAVYALKYRQYKQQYHFISFSDILVLAFNALFFDTHRQYKRYPWIQVDEVQDLNPLQTAIIDLLVDPSSSPTIMYLGDEQQAIFSFLGAKISQLELLKDKCHGNIIHLNQNYRSPKYCLSLKKVDSSNKS